VGTHCMLLMFDINIDVIKIMSKFPSRHQVELQGELKLTETQKKSNSYVVIIKGKGKGKAVPLQAWSGSEGSTKLRFPDFMTTAQDGGKFVSLMHRPPLPP